jgi:hypothetical protein
MDGYWNSMYLNPFSKGLSLFERKKDYIDASLDRNLTVPCPMSCLEKKRAFLEMGNYAVPMTEKATGKEIKTPDLFRSLSLAQKSRN